MLNLETRDDLNRLVAEGITESLTLDYKASPSLGKTDKQLMNFARTLPRLQILLEAKSSMALRRSSTSPLG